MPPIGISRRCPLLIVDPTHYYCFIEAVVEVGGGSGLRGVVDDGASKGILTKWVHWTRLVTRTKESNMNASIRVIKLLL